MFWQKSFWQIDFERERALEFNIVVGSRVGRFSVGFLFFSSARNQKLWV